MNNNIFFFILINIKNTGPQIDVGKKNIYETY